MQPCIIEQRPGSVQRTVPGKGELSLGQFAELFYLYEISLWVPEGREISIASGSGTAAWGRRGALSHQPGAKSDIQVCGVCSFAPRVSGTLVGFLPNLRLQKSLQTGHD